MGDTRTWPRLVGRFTQALDGRSYWAQCAIAGAPPAKSAVRPKSQCQHIKNCRSQRGEGGLVSPLQRFAVVAIWLLGLSHSARIDAAENVVTLAAGERPPYIGATLAQKGYVFE